MNRRFSSIWRASLIIMLLASMLLPAGAPAVIAAPQQIMLADTTNIWCVAGSFQGWNNASHSLNDDGVDGDIIAGDGIYSRQDSIGSAGFYEWKVVACGDWGTSFPSQNSWFSTSSDGQTVTFTFDTNDHSSDAGAAYLPATNIVNVSGDSLPASFTAVGDFQGWNNADPATQLSHVGNGIYRLAFDVPSPGNYIGKITSTGSWNAFGSGGRSIDAGNIAFSTAAPNQTAIFLLDTATGRALIQPNGSTTANWCAAGDFNGWNNASTPLVDDGTNGDLLGGDGVFSRLVTVATAGRGEFKAVECGNWGNAYPPQNAWYVTAADNQEVLVTFDTNDHSGDAGLAWLPAQNIVNAVDSYPTSWTAVGPWQGWDNANPATALTNHGNGLFHLAYTFASATSTEGKFTQTGNWDNQFNQFGRQNGSAGVLPFTVYSDGDVVDFLLDLRAGRMALITPPPGGAGHDNNIFYDDLYHDSRDGLFRDPGGPIAAGSGPVNLRLRAAAGDLTGATVRLWNDRLNQQSFLPMTLVYTDADYEYWEAVVSATDEPTIFYYRFIANDGTATAYYEDDAAVDGGSGQAISSSVDRSWQLTVYDPAFSTPEWVKNAVIYQVFPDRFRDGDPSNNPAAGEFFYNDPRGTIVRSNTSEWNAAVCDPRDTTDPDCDGTYSQNFYGGDLQGLIDKLDYLQDLGVTAIYLNPVFESPSNHKYDATDYSVIDDAFGDLATFQALVSQANARGINLILDGVFNHVSSDSIYFDRYGRYAELGACESPSSPYRAWFYFNDVPAGSGACAGSDGTPLAANYTSWFGYDSLPKLDSANPEVRDLIWSGGDEAIGKYWQLEGADGWRLDVGGDVDPGLTNDPANDYWEGFRTAVRSANPDGYIVGEEWGNASAWVLGSEWDATMNYQYSSAMLSFWRDSAFVDNDHNSGSSAGPLNPISPSQLDARLHNWIERYPPEALQAMMNLLGSHDTNRPLFMLDHNAATGTNDALLMDPAYDWSDPIARLKGVAILQFTLPGAPTIYYGDEVGLVGPVTYDGSTWQDDPYNRQPYPWLDESGTPFYTHLQTSAGQSELLDHYKLLTAARNAHAALRTGSFDTLLIDDAGMVYAYGRKAPLGASQTDAAVVIVNRGATASVTVDVSGYLPYGTTLTNALDGSPVIVSASGEITLTVPAEFGAVLVVDAPLTAQPYAAANLAVTAERSNEIDLAWDAVSGSNILYRVFRSGLSGGGFSQIGTSTSPIYTDSGLTTGQTYYYYVTAEDTTVGLAGIPSNTVAGIPSYTIGWANTQWPPSITHTIGTTPTENIYGQVWIDGVTGNPGPTLSLLAQIGYGPAGTTPATWTMWMDASFNGDAGNNDEFYASLTPEQTGSFQYAYRYSTNSGRDWLYADLSGPIDPSSPVDLGDLTVNPSGDTTPPSTPANLMVTDWGSDFIALGWEASTDDTAVYAYDVYRSTASGDLGMPVGRVLSPEVSFTDTAVTTGVTYYYSLVALDTSFNASGASGQVSQAAEPKTVSVTFRVGVPDYTPGTVYLAGNLPGYPEWNPGATAMTQVSDNPDIWEITVSLPDGAAIQYKYTRGSWDTVEAWGSITGLTNRSAQISYGTSGTQLIDNTATDWGNGDDNDKAVQLWRDPLVVSHIPADGADGQSPEVSVDVVFSLPMASDTQFSVTGESGPVAGSFGLVDSHTVRFIPDAPFAFGEYTVTVSGTSSDGGQPQQSVSTFSFLVGFHYEPTISDLIGMLNYFNDNGHITGNKTYQILSNRLHRAQYYLEMGRLKAARGQIESFLQQVDAFSPQFVTPEAAEALTEEGSRVLEQIPLFN